MNNPWDYDHDPDHGATDHFLWLPPPEEMIGANFNAAVQPNAGQPGDGKVKMLRGEITNIVFSSVGDRDARVITVATIHVKPDQMDGRPYMPTVLRPAYFRIGRMPGIYEPTAVVVVRSSDPGEVPTVQVSMRYVDVGIAKDQHRIEYLEAELAKLRHGGENPDKVRSSSASFEPKVVQGIGGATASHGYWPSYAQFDPDGAKRRDLFAAAAFAGAFAHPSDANINAEGLWAAVDKFIAADPKKGGSQ